MALIHDCFKSYEEYRERTVVQEYLQAEKNWKTIRDRYMSLMFTYLNLKQLQPRITKFHKIDNNRFYVTCKFPSNPNLVEFSIPISIYNEIEGIDKCRLKIKELVEKEKKEQYLQKLEVKREKYMALIEKYKDNIAKLTDEIMELEGL